MQCKLLAPLEAAKDAGTAQEPYTSDEADTGQDSGGVKKNGEELLGTVCSLVL